MDVMGHGIICRQMHLLALAVKLQFQKLYIEGEAIALDIWQGELQAKTRPKVHPCRAKIRPDVCVNDFSGLSVRYADCM